MLEAVLGSGGGLGLRDSSVIGPPSMFCYGPVIVRIKLKSWFLSGPTECQASLNAVDQGWKLNFY